MRSGPGLQFPEYRPDMRSDGVLADVEPCRNLRVRPAVGHEQHHCALSLGHGSTHPRRLIAASIQWQHSVGRCGMQHFGGGKNNRRYHL